MLRGRVVIASNGQPLIGVRVSHEHLFAVARFSSKFLFYMPSLGLTYSVIIMFFSYVFFFSQRIQLVKIQGRCNQRGKGTNLTFLGGYL